MSFSVLMSVYKKENPEYFDIAMKSIWDDQTLKPNEIVLVEDGELTESLYKIIEKWKTTLKDILVSVPLKENIGFAKALNIGLKYCTNELIIRMDTDDISMPSRFKEQIQFMQEHKDIAVCGTFTEEFDVKYKKQINFPINFKDIKKFAKLRNPIAHPSVIFKKSIIEKVGGYPENLRLGQDFGLWSVLMANGYILQNIPQVLLRMRINSEFIKRRGWESFKYEVKIIKLQYNLGFINLFEAAKALFLRFVLRMSPTFIKKLMYKILK